MPVDALDIVLPCYNPAQNWAQNIVHSLNNLNRLLPGTQLHIYLVNDGSVHGVTEADLAFLKKQITHLRYIQNPENRGKGHALRQGVSQTQGNFCIYTDIDFPYTEASLKKIYDALRAGKGDVIVGVRDEKYYKNMPPTRTKISKTLHFFTKKLLHLPVSDTQAGLKGFNRRGREIFLKTTIDRYLFDLEFVFEAARAPGIYMKPILVNLKPNISFSKMNFNILITESISFLKLILSVRFLNKFK